MVQQKGGEGQQQQLNGAREEYLGDKALVCTLRACKSRGQLLDHMRSERTAAVAAQLECIKHSTLHPHQWFCVVHGEADERAGGCRALWRLQAGTRAVLRNPASLPPLLLLLRPQWMACLQSPPTLITTQTPCARGWQQTSFASGAARAAVSGGAALVLWRAARLPESARARCAPSPRLQASACAQTRDSTTQSCACMRMRGSWPSWLPSRKSRAQQLVQGQGGWGATRSAAATPACAPRVARFWARSPALRQSPARCPLACHACAGSRPICRSGWLTGGMRAWKR